MKSPRLINDSGKNLSPTSKHKSREIRLRALYSHTSHRKSAQKPEHLQRILNPIHSSTVREIKKSDHQPPVSDRNSSSPKITKARQKLTTLPPISNTISPPHYYPSFSSHHQPATRYSLSIPKPSAKSNPILGPRANPPTVQSTVRSRYPWR